MDFWVSKNAPMMYMAHLPRKDAVLVTEYGRLEVLTGALK
jgi:tellurite resistance-related uncharacterized protein